VFSTVAFAVSIAQAAPPATHEQENRIQSTLRVAVGMMAPVTACDFPQPAPSDFLAVVGSYEGSALPSVTIAGQDEETSLADVEIKPGRNPVYLVLSGATPIIWRITGDTNRVRHVITFHSTSAGVVGIPAEKVRFSHQQNCPLPHDFYDGRKLETDVPVLAIFGRRPNGIAADYGLYRAVVDDAGVTVDRSHVRNGEDVLIMGNRPQNIAFPHAGINGPSTLELEFHKLFPAGVVRLKPDDVVASGPVAPYEVLPMTAGALELEQSGALIPATADDVRRWKDRAVISGRVRADQITELDFSSAYRVTRPIRIPAGLCGGYLMTFFVPSRDFVKGDPCHSNIYVDDGTIMASPAEFFQSSN